MRDRENTSISWSLLSYLSLFTANQHFLLAAIVTPTDAVAVKSITTNMKVPKNVNGALEYESLFNDASGIVLLDLGRHLHFSRCKPHSIIEDTMNNSRCNDG